MKVLVMATVALAGSMASFTPVERYLASAVEIGCPEDQVRNFFDAGIVLQPRQLAAAAAARLCDAPDGPTEIGMGGARAGGKSFWGLAQVGVDDCQRYPGLTCLLLRKVGKSTRESLEHLRRKLFRFVPHDYRRAGVVEFANGSRIIAGHFQYERDVDAYLGLEYDEILVEEATTLTKSKVDDIRTCCRSSKPGWRPRIYLTFNPGGVGHAWAKARFVEPYRKGTESETRFIPSTVDDNCFVNPENRKILEGLTGWKLRAWRYGDWDIAAGQFFTTFKREHDGRPHHVIPWFEPPRHWRVWVAKDYGFTHYTAAYLLAQDGDGDVFYMGEHAERGWLPERHVAGIRSMLARNGVDESRLETIVAGHDVFNKDRRGTSIAEDYASLGLRLNPADVDRVNGAGEFLRRLGDVDAGIRPTVFITDACPRLIECLPSLEHDPHRPEDVLKVDTDEDGQGGDDFYDAARYGLMHARGRRRASRGGAGLLDSYRG